MTDTCHTPAARRAAPQAGLDRWRPWRRACQLTIVLIALSAAGGLFITPSPYYPDSLLFLTLLCVRTQDLPVGAAMAVFLAAAALLAGRGGPPQNWRGFGGRWAALILVVLVAALWLLRTRVLFDHDFTRDEQMATFDAAIYARGRLAWPVPEPLRAWRGAFNDLFLLPVADRSVVVSSYLPINALLRALAGAVLPASLVSPLLTALAGGALWQVARRLWPDDRTVRAVVLILFVGSSQVVLTGTATFAMSTHLALNMVWLALFLRGTRAGHVAALATGFLATGIHQPIFHPLFVLPFLDLLRRQRRWQELAFYCAGYAFVGAVWLAWPHWVMHQIGAGLPVGPSVAIGDRLSALLVRPNLDAIWVMCGNLLRFVAWEHILLVPLALVGVRYHAPRDDLARALALGVVLLVIAMTVLLPPQGHGWGYRYLHGHIGALCLLAGFGWRWLAQRGCAPQRAFALATAGSLLVLLPLHVAMVRSFVAPFARTVAAFQKLDADYVVVETGELPFGTNFVLNRPDLANRPRLLLGSAVNPPLLARLCPGHSIAFADAWQFNKVRAFYEDPPRSGPGPLQSALRATAARAGCRVVSFTPPDGV